LSHDEAAQREQRTSKAESSRVLGPQVDEDMVWAALAKSVDAVTTKDLASLGKRLDDFADLLRTDPALADLRFDEAEFGVAVERSLGRLGRSRGVGARRRIFRFAMEALGDLRTLQALRDRLARAIKTASLSVPNRDAVAAAVICMAPVLERVPLPPSESPTIEIIFNVQLEAWLGRRQSAGTAPEVDETVKRLLISV
jgi:hypothetical protein